MGNSHRNRKQISNSSGCDWQWITMVGKPAKSPLDTNADGADYTGQIILFFNQCEILTFTEQFGNKICDPLLDTLISDCDVKGPSLNLGI